jgi:hypothetical protein
VIDEVFKGVADQLGDTGVYLICLEKSVQGFFMSLAQFLGKTVLLKGLQAGVFQIQPAFP